MIREATPGAPVSAFRNRTIVIVGGVAGGASCAARLRRQDEYARIVMLERGPFVSSANCGLPYHVGGVIEDEAALLIADAALFRNRFAVDVRTGETVVAIDTAARRLTVRRENNSTYTLDYDKLVLSPGARPIRARCTFPRTSCVGG